MAKPMEITILPPTAENAMMRKARIAVTPQTMEQNFRFWTKLAEKEQGIVLEESQRLSNAMTLSEVADLAKGMHLAKLNEVLAPKGQFRKFLRKFTGYSPKQAQRLINGYRNSSEHLSPPVIEAAIRRRIRIFGDDPAQPFGIHTVAVRQLEDTIKGRVGPGPSATPEQIDAWLTKVVDFTKKRKSLQLKAKKSGRVLEIEGDSDPEDMLRESYRFVNSRFKRLPHNSATRRKWVERLFGMILHDLGVTGSKSFEPQAVPDDIKPRPIGRPALKAAVGDSNGQ